VTTIGRKKLGISHHKLKEVLHQDFADCSALAEALSGQDAAVFCLGTYTGAVSEADLRKVTLDYTIKDQIAGRGIVGKCLAQLLDNPRAGRTPGDIAVKDSSPIMCDNEKAV
jgi:hypothetical protein